MNNKDTPHHSENSKEQESTAKQILYYITLTHLILIATLWGKNENFQNFMRQKVIK